MSAIQVFKSENGKYVFDVQAFKQILSKSLNNLVALYSMAGPLRLGKSFMLGFFHRYLKMRGHESWVTHDLPNTFTFRCGADRDTVGIWMWSEPFVVRKTSGESVYIYLLDTQGCFDDKTSMKDNAIIFGLSTLLSSVMVFNISRQLSEDVLHFMQYFAGYARLADDDNRDEPFQRLMFLIRDWQFPDYDCGYYDDYNSDSNGRNYKKDKFNVRDSMATDVKFIHESLMSSFEKVSFYLLPHPGREVAQHSVFNVDKVDEDFLKHLRLFVPLVLNPKNIVHKKVGGRAVTGAALIGHVEKWVAMFESDVMPDTKNIFQSAVELQNEMAKSAAFDHYSRRMNDRITETDGMNAMEFKTFNSKLFTESVAIFMSFKRFGAKPEDRLIVEEGLQTINIIYHQINKVKHEIKLRDQGGVGTAKHGGSKRDPQVIKHLKSGSPCTIL